MVALRTFYEKLDLYMSFSHDVANTEMNFQVNENLFSFFLDKFKKITRDFALFHLLFASLALVEITGFLIFFSTLSASSWLAVSLALLLFTGFAYVVLKFYFECKKPEQLMRLRDHFLDICKEKLPFTEGSKEFHLRIAEALFQMSAKLEDEEYLYYQFSSDFKTLNTLLKRFSCFLHWKDLFAIKEILMVLAIEQQVELIQAHPCDIEAHAALAESYANLARLYRAPCRSYEKWHKKEAIRLSLWEKFTETASLSLEEFSILEALAGQNPWVLAQKASLYHDLEKPMDEIREYERMLEINPQEEEVLFHLGMLYFSEGFTTKGLTCYEKLKEISDDVRAQAMMRLYDAKFRKIADKLITN